MDKEKALIAVAFFDRLEKGARGKSFIERMIQRNQKYWHVEVAFEKRLMPHGHPLRNAPGDFMVAYGITARDIDGTVGRVFERARVFHADNYDDSWKFLRVPQEDAVRAMQFAQGQVGKLYDPWGHFAALVCPRESHYDTQRWYCANLTTAILQQATPTLHGLHPGAMSMDDIHNSLCDDVELTNSLSPKQRNALLARSRTRITHNFGSNIRR